MALRPMHEATFLILTALADERRHGYAVLQEVQQISGGQVTLRAGTLYAALDRLLGSGLVRVDAEEIIDNRLRRYYALTETGRGELAAEAERRHRHTGVALRRLRSAGGAA